MVANIPNLSGISAKICKLEAQKTLNMAVVCDSSKVSDHHAIVPTISADAADISVLPTGEHEILRLVARQLLCAVAEPFRYAETVVTSRMWWSSFHCKGKRGTFKRLESLS